MADNPAQPFADMAERIAAMKPEEFAGAVVIVPPGEGMPIAFTTTDLASPDILQFLVAVETRVQVRKNEELAAAQEKQPWARR